jgi:hypothetical protein
MTLLSVQSKIGFKYYVNGKRVAREVHRDLTVKAIRENRLNSCHTVEKNGAYYHYSCA